MKTKIHMHWSPRAKVAACGERVTDNMEVGTILPFDAIVLYAGYKDASKPGEVELEICEGCKKARSKTGL